MPIAKLDVAIAVAGEDLSIAEKIAASLKSRNISYYLYTEHSVDSWGKHLLKISIDQFSNDPKFILVFVSQAFARKYWSGIETQIMQTYRKHHESILPLQLDDTRLDGMSSHIVFETWKGNEEEIADKIAGKVKLRRKKAKQKWAGISAVGLLLVAAVFFLLALTRINPDYSSYLAYLQKGDSLIKQKNFPAAKVEIKRALAYNPGDPVASRKLALLDSADHLIKANDFTAAQKLFQVIISIPASQGISEEVLSGMGVSSNPSIIIFVEWNGNTLEIKVSGGVPFEDAQQPYKIEGLQCQSCIQWKKTGDQYIANVTGISVKISTIQLRDRVGQFANHDIPVNPHTGEGVTNPSPDPVNTKPVKDPLADKPAPPPAGAPVVKSKESLFASYTRSGDSLFAAKQFPQARVEYQQALSNKPGDSRTSQKIAACDSRINAAEETAAKAIDRVRLGGGTFTMGTDNGNTDDGPGHAVVLGNFSLSTTEVTVAQYKSFCRYTGRSMPPPPRKGWADDHPIVNVTWNEALAYCQWVGGRLPTEAEWEYAAHAGSNQTYSGSNQIDPVAWYSSNSGDITAEVKKKAPNKFGLYDMTGNVSEWCSDWYDGKYYSQSTKDNPRGPAAGNERVIRGGAFNSAVNSTQDGSNQLRITYRNSESPGARKEYIGFRVAWNK